MAKLRVDHGPIDEGIAKKLTKEEKEWLRSWNRHAEIPGEDAPRAAADEGGEGDQDAAGYGDLTNDELKDKLRERGLPVSGNKDELVERLEADDANGDEEDSEEDEEDSGSEED